LITMTIQPTDLFLVNTSSGPTIAGSKGCEAQKLSSKNGTVLVNRGGSSYRTTIAEITTKVLDDDLMLVNRGGSSFKVTGAEVKELFIKLGTAVVTGATFINASTTGAYTCTVTGSTASDLVYSWSVSGGGFISSETSPTAYALWSTANSTQTVTCTVSSPSASGTTADTLTVNVGLPPIYGAIPNRGGSVRPGNIIGYACNLSPDAAQQTCNPSNGVNGFAWTAVKMSGTGINGNVTPSQYSGSPGGQVASWYFSGGAVGNSYEIQCTVRNDNYAPIINTFKCAQQIYVGTFFRSEIEADPNSTETVYTSSSPPIDSENTPLNEWDVWVDEVDNSEYVWRTTNGGEWIQNAFLDGTELTNSYYYDETKSERVLKANAPDPEEPRSVNGYYPLYRFQKIAELAGNGSTHSHTFDGITWHMPNGVTYYHGDYSG